ncbi:hypothetical protein SPYCA_3243 [Sphingopyxis sp. FD7]|nr:hypothetical protein SPYCA_3243 [Sphingopyxis sp. FD7]
MRARERRAFSWVEPDKRARTPRITAAAIKYPVAWSSACTGKETGRSADRQTMPAAAMPEES